MYLSGEEMGNLLDGEKAGQNQGVFDTIMV